MKNLLFPHSKTQIRIKRVKECLSYHKLKQKLEKNKFHGPLGRNVQFSMHIWPLQSTKGSKHKDGAIGV